MAERGCEAVGIDLGTTYSAMAYLDEQMTPRMVQDSSGQAVVPSVVFFDDEEVVVGDIALQQARMQSDRCAQFVKVHMGDDWKREFNGQTHTPESVSAIILAHLVREAEPQIGPISKAVITVPAYFTEKRRRATQQAGEIAGLEVIGTLNEPMSAALAFGLYREDKEQVAVVYDLGGGTFDVTVVRISPNELTELATLGNRQLGGRDWDQALVNYVADDFKKQFNVDPRDDSQAKQDLVIACEQAKRRLGRMNQTAVRLHALGHDHNCQVTRAEFESMTAPLLQATRLTTEMALQDADVKWDDVAKVVLVGGSTHMPKVREMLKEVSGQDPDTGVNPVLAVALGAAQYAHMLESGNAPTAVHQKQDDDAIPVDPEINIAGMKRQSDASVAAIPQVGFVTAHGVGVKALVNKKKANVVLIRKNARVPCEVSKTFKTIPDANGQTRQRIPIEVTQGDTPQLDLAETLGRGQIEGIPGDDPPGQPVKVTMSFDQQGRLHVNSLYVNSGQELNIELEIPGGLAEEQVQEYKELLQTAGLVQVIEEDEPAAAAEFEVIIDDSDDDIPLLQPVD